MVIEFIDDQLRQVIGLAKDQAAVFNIAQGFTIVPCLLNTVEEKGFIDLLIFVTGKQAHHDLRLWVDIAPSDEFLIMGVHIHYLSHFGRTIQGLALIHLVAKYPGMAHFHPPADVLIQKDALHMP